MTIIKAYIFCIFIHYSGSDGRVLPSGKLMHQFGIKDELIQDISEVVLSACASLFEMYAGLHSRECRINDVNHMEYLIHNAGYHHVRFTMLCSVIPLIKYDKAGKLIKPDKPIVWPSAIRGNKFHMLMFHLSQAKLQYGADLRIIDTQESESKHRSSVKCHQPVCKKYFNYFS